MHPLLLHFLSVIVGIGGFLIINKFLGTYFTKKGENQATKEDIGQITEIVEDIKTKLLKETEILKAQISVRNQHILNLKTVERDALLDFHKNTAAWVSYLSVVSFREVEENPTGNLIEKTYTLIANFELAFDRLRLFIDDIPFHKKVVAFKQVALKNQDYVFTKHVEQKHLKNHQRFEEIDGETSEQKLLRNNQELDKFNKDFERDKENYFKETYLKYLELFKPLKDFLANLENEKAVVD